MSPGGSGIKTFFFIPLPPSVTEHWDVLKIFILARFKIKVAPYPIIVSLDTLISRRLVLRESSKLKVRPCKKLKIALQGGFKADCPSRSSSPLLGWCFLLPFFPVQDRCAFQSHRCSPQANCTNVLGSIRCDCNAGFNGTGWDCTGKPWVYKKLPWKLASSFLVQLVSYPQSFQNVNPDQDTTLTHVSRTTKFWIMKKKTRRAGNLAKQNGKWTPKNQAAKTYHNKE